MVEKITKKLKIVEIRDYTKFVKGKKKDDKGELKNYRSVSLKDKHSNFSIMVTDEIIDHPLAELRRNIDVNTEAEITLVIKASSQKTLDEM